MEKKVLKKNIYDYVNLGREHGSSDHQAGGDTTNEEKYC